MIEQEAELQKEVAKYRTLVANAEKTKNQGESSTKANQNKAADAKASMQKKQNELFDIRKQIAEAKVQAKKIQTKGAALDAPLDDATAKAQKLRDQVNLLQSQYESMTEEYAKVMESIEWWHKQRRQVAKLHEQAHELLNKDQTSPQSTPRAKWKG